MDKRTKQKIKMRSVLFFSFMAVALMSSSAIATDYKFGMTTHDLDMSSKKQSNETGPSIVAEIVSEPISWIDFGLRPRAYANITLNTAGHTNYVSAGLLWRGQVSDQWFAETSLGLALHDGKTEIEDISPAFSDERNAELAALDDDYIEFGSRDLFRWTAGIGYHFSPKHAVVFSYEHLSHGQILGNGSNEALDAIGVSFMFRR